MRLVRNKSTEYPQSATLTLDPVYVQFLQTYA
jgi:hypothetical protein